MSTSFDAPGYGKKGGSRVKKICFIIPFFGRLPNYFALFLKSCACNPDYNWLLFTDDSTEYCYPINVERVLISFSDIKKLACKKIGFPVVLDAPYKLCDYKPAYGLIFEDYLEKYDFWGHCDIDVIMGNLSTFLTDALLDSYDKLFCLGHFVLYRNSSEINHAFMLDYEGNSVYREVFSTSSICVFDEECRTPKNVNRIFKQHGFRVFEQDWSLNFSIFRTPFYRVCFAGTEQDKTKFFTEPECNYVIVWENGHVNRYSLKNDFELCREEFMYLHLQERHMKWSAEDILPLSKIKIVPDRFLPLEFPEITSRNFSKIKIRYFSLHQYYRLKKENKRRFGKLKLIIKKMLGKI